LGADVGVGFRIERVSDQLLQRGRMIELSQDA
jgi:hypothetical protein